MEIRISVRNLVEFILRSGDIDNRRVTTADNSMLEGGRIHRMIRKHQGSESSNEGKLSFGDRGEGISLWELSDN